ncbi:PTS system, beta-glucoside-specific IIB component [Pediococcus damnosus]|uniref:PTS system sucrose-specific EIIBCA component n=1 Tax=Pediococcus damnosus TaxID=51663 RepID=A0A143AKJ3_9LACO|nr:PTS beta-glucoside transporter subunit IIBCA [Pediococcus damnosus]AMV63117.1 PTS system, beta-glucoside-specific IIB component [Pediococcus damnosus]AMV64736.1 PTS system, beta-glucoside-specific IIB component [Pediococcus damnosus]AMV66991.1 PTS system, beta-glucoside-specific IIB component [Pediococcus damnosus]AMV69408.1 PTS system, beta-glucoside-specific IIB component [Pediococcus damnosus]KJU73493.1 PTS beta-glucoside transporter subunit IIABC [Pediococcus damnosus LMG 28219]
MDYKDSAKQIYKAVGEDKNINSLIHCMTRLRFRLKDESIVNDDTVKKIPGVMGVNHQSGQYQVIMGNDVSNYYDEILKLGNINTGDADQTSDQSDQGEEKKKTNWFNRFANFISSCMSPIIPALIGGGMIKVILILLPMWGWMSEKGQTYAILNIFGDAPFYFLPIMLAYTAAQYFKVTPMLAMTVAGIMIHPNFTAMVKAGHAVHFMGLPVTLVNYSSSVIPILMVVWAMKYIEMGVDKICPSSIKSILKPLLVLFITGTLALVVIGPIGTYAGKLLSTVILFIQSKAGWLAMALMTAFMPLIVMTGMHWAFAPIFLAASVANPDSLILPAMLASNIAQGAASLAVAAKTKNRNTRQVAGAASISALLAGVTEPALYGVTLKYKKPLYASMISGAITGLFMGIVKLKSFTFAVPSLLSLPQFVSKTDSSNIVNAVIVVIVSFVLTFVLTWVFGIDEKTPATASATDTTTATDATTTADAQDTPKTTKVVTNNVHSGSKETKKVYSPVKGEMINLESVSDDTFAKKMLGDGVAIIPEEGKIYAPFDGQIMTVFPTKHAIGLKSDTGIELLIHIGLDTVNLKGAPFTAHVKDNDQVKKGQLLMDVDLDAIKKAGYDITTPIVVTNTKDFVEIVSNDKTTVTNDDVALYVI